MATSAAAAAAAAARGGTHLSRARAALASAFFYDLPKERIATRPAATRSASKLLVAAGPSPHAPSTPHHHAFQDLPSLLPPSSRLIMNTSRVIRARVPMTKRTGGAAQVLLLSPADKSDPTPLLSAPLAGMPLWKVFIGGRRIRVGDTLTASAPALTLTATVVSRAGPAAEVRFGGSAPSLAAALDALGHTPLPPYMDRDADAADASAYQTVYAERAGSVAAPTAGLHVTDSVLDGLRERGIAVSRVTLHVGAGTFLPMGGETAGEHDMHEERFHVATREVREIADDARRSRTLVAMVRASADAGVAFE
jgi:S-adenosylmethionine:tRNA ribosyltransferase-isomerase